MSRLPQLERDLVDAAARRRRRTYAGLLPRVVRPALALAALAAIVAGIALAGVQHDPEREVTGERRVQPVPPETFAISERLTRADLARPRPPIAHEDLPAAAEKLQAQTPYPPGRRDDFDWSATPPDPRDAGAISAASDVQALIEYRSRCLWLRYWLDAHAARHTVARDGALRILLDSRAWPSARRPDDHLETLVGAAERGDADRVRDHVERDCRDRPDPVGGPGPDPVGGYEPAPPEEGYEYGARPRTLARIGERFAIVGYVLRPPGRPGDVCLDLVRVSDGTGSGCHSPTHRAQGYESSPGGARALGATTDAVDEIVVRYRQGSRKGSAEAMLGRADDPAALDALDLRPFTFYVAELPAGAKPVEAVATLGGREVWRAPFP